MSAEFKPKLSIITSVFKGGKFIEPFLIDITRQTYFNQSELILINANSPENEERVILKYLQLYSNILYTKLDKDPGVYAVWNMGIKKARGEYLTNANLDDRKNPRHLERHVNILDENPDVDLAYADVLLSNTQNETFEECNPVSVYNFPEYSYSNLLKYNMPHNNPVWRKSLHEKYGYFREDMLSAADFEMWLRAASNGSVFKRINEVLSLYYKNPDGISTKSETLQRAVEEVNKIRSEYVNKSDYRNFLI